MPRTVSFELTWLGHAAFHLLTPGGKSILFDPWLGNPKFPAAWKRPDKIDALLLTHGHNDHVGDAVELALAHHSEVVASFELCNWLSKKGAKETRGMNKGGTQTIAGVGVTMVRADHSSGIADGDSMVYGGEAAGFVVTLEDGFRLYHAGDTNVFSDMALIRELYAPDIALLPIGGHYTMGPLEAAKAVELLQPRWVVPMHYGTFPLLAGTPDALARHIAGRSEAKIVTLSPGETLRELP